MSRDSPSRAEEVMTHEKLWIWAVKVWGVMGARRETETHDGARSHDIGQCG